MIILANPKKRSLCYSAKRSEVERKTELQPLEKVLGSMERHLKGILATFKHNVTNAVTKGLHSKMQSPKSAARGFQNVEPYRVRILLFCEKLNLMPAIRHPDLSGISIFPMRKTSDLWFCQKTNLLRRDTLRRVPNFGGILTKRWWFH